VKKENKDWSRPDLMGYFTRIVSETVSLWRPRARRADSTLRPLLLLIRFLSAGGLKCPFHRW